MCSCSEAFHSLRACAVVVVGVAGTMPIHGIGTACFILLLDGKEHVLMIHNCLFCHGEDGFNLLSVSQMIRTGRIEVVFNQGSSRVDVKKTNDSHELQTVQLKENDGLYEIEVTPLYLGDRRIATLPRVEITLEDDSKLWEIGESMQAYAGLKAPTRLGTWHSKLLWMSCKVGIQGVQNIEYTQNLNEFCNSYFVPPSQPTARRTYKTTEVDDMADLSLRFMGVGTDRLRHTLERSRGLRPASKKKGENVSVVPPLNFPQGKWKAGKTPRVSKNKVQHLHKASIAEVCFTDTFETEDSTYRYGQAFVDYRSRFGDVYPIRSRKRVGWAIGEFCCCYYVPLILIRDNIAENVGGAVEEECHRRGIKSAFICPYTKQQDYAEGYLGRVTAMASFAMVFSGAPLFMWRWAIKCATFINNITATYYQKEKIWAVPWEILHGEPFPDASIVVPFGCAALVLLNEAERGKFRGTCVMMIFIHYALDHPLYTYALFSPRTKRVVYRQDVIFLTNVFPMREARMKGGLQPDGEALVTYRSPPSPVGIQEAETSFGDWQVADPLPIYQDDVTGYSLVSPPDQTSLTSRERDKEWPGQAPNHPSFGPRSAVKVPLPWESRHGNESLNGGKDDIRDVGSEVEETDKRSRPKRMLRDNKLRAADTKSKRIPVNQRWYYEPALMSNSSGMTRSQDQIQGGEPGLGPKQLCPNVEVLARKDREMLAQAEAVSPLTDCYDDVRVCTALSQVLGSHNVNAQEDARGSGQEQFVPNSMEVRGTQEPGCLPMDSWLYPKTDAVASSVGSASSRAGERKGSQTGQTSPKVILQSPRHGLLEPGPSVGEDQGSASRGRNGADAFTEEESPSRTNEVPSKGREQSESKSVQGGRKTKKQKKLLKICSKVCFDSGENQSKVKVSEAKKVNLLGSGSEKVDTQSKCFNSDGKMEKVDVRGFGKMEKVDVRDLEKGKLHENLISLLPNSPKENNKIISFSETDTSIKVMNCSVPPSLGPTEQIPFEHIEAASDDEATACRLQGLVFLDDELGWCVITNWGVDYGVNIIFYTPVHAMDPVTEEHHASLSEILALVKQTSNLVRISNYRSSRTLSGLLWKRVGLVRLMSAKREVPRHGTMHARKVTGVAMTVKALSTRVLRRILKAQETLFKYGTLIPRSDREAEQSPEAIRWRSGRQLEWLRLLAAKTFETDWTWERIRKEFPDYKRSEIGHMFYIYDYKYSGEHRVRLVFDGSRQSPNTYSITYAPTVRAESVRLFHLYAVEYGWHIQQYDVPQAFLRSDADCTIFVHPPKGQSDFPGQILKLSKMLYGSKQAAALWFNLLNTFLMRLGFVASSMDPCFYRRKCQTTSDPTCSRSDAIIILHVDDMRVAAEKDVLARIHDQLFQEFQITTSDSGRFLGMDTEYDLDAGVFKMHMATYIESTVQRFTGFDLSCGLPYRELVGSLLWIVLCVMGTELLRVKDLARRSNNYSLDDYNEALHVLDRINSQKHYGIIFRRGCAGTEYVPACTRLGGGLDDIDKDFSIGDATEINELEENNLYKLDSLVDDVNLDIEKVLADTNKRFTKVAYTDASFAVGETKQSISGFVILINGVPILWGSLKQTIVVDSTCSAEYVAASVCCKQIMQAENMVQFLDFSCPRPYKLYTDSQACLKIATTASKMGLVRHLEIRYHLVRCIVLSGNVELIYCITEEMLADLFTKIVATAQDKRLAIRFYNDCVVIR
jgi:hypothetical protein